jgi:endonuclease/exonuclease/phosphatase family metal-dependent hydrolase
LKNNAESNREKQIAQVIKSVLESKFPVIILGDFNEPSYRDWTEKTKNMFAHNGAIVPWPTTKLLEKNGFKDAFRTFYSDEVKNPGITWPSVMSEKNKITTWTPKSDDRDRVDYIFYKGRKLNLKSVFIVGPKCSFSHNKKTSDNTGNDPFLCSDMLWPSDHKGVFAEFQLK